MIRIFQALNGSQDSELAHAQAQRFRTEFHEDHGKTEGEWHTKIRKSVPPGFLVPYKGSMAVSLSRPFALFVLDHPVARRLFNWSRTTFIAEEQFWATLVHNLNLDPPGGYPGLTFYKIGEITDAILIIITLYNRSKKYPERGFII